MVEQIIQAGFVWQMLIFWRFRKAMVLHHRRTAVRLRLWYQFTIVFQV